MKHIYLCGPVSGRKNQDVVTHFFRIDKRLRDASDTPVRISNPMRFCPQDLGSWHKEMKVCIGELVRCDGIALLQGWQKSRGAALELKLAQDLHIPVVYIEPPVDSVYLTELFTASPESVRYYNARITQFYNEGTEETLAETRALAELTNRYLDPYGFEYIEISQEG